MDLDSVADQLYALSPDEFIGARGEAVKKATDAELKRGIKALRRPTASAHAVNRITREQAADLDSLLALGDELRAAMAGKGGDVRELSEQRRQLVSALIAGVLSAAVRDDVTATLEAATADPQLAAAVRSGRLVKPLRYAGFGEFPDLDEFVATPLARQAAPKKTAPASKTTASQRPAPDTPDLATMRQHVLELAGAADDAQRRYDEAARAVTEARTLLDRAEKDRADAHKEARAAHAEAERARRELGRLERR